jgi:hypothetical protein
MVGYSDNCRLWKHDVYFLLPGEQILSHSYDLKKIGAISRYPYFFQPYPFMVSERTIMWESVY